MQAYSLLLAVWASTFNPCVRADDKPAAFSISFDSARLEEISVEKGKLHYVWHTLRAYDKGKERPDAQSLDSYDRHQIDVWLTDKERERFQDWVGKYKIFDFKERYASEGKSYGAAFQQGLTVVQSDRKHGIAWAGDSKIPKELGDAIGELRSLAEEAAKSRNK